MVLKLLQPSKLQWVEMWKLLCLHFVSCTAETEMYLVHVHVHVAKNSHFCLRVRVRVRGTERGAETPNCDNTGRLSSTKNLETNENTPQWTDTGLILFRLELLSGDLVCSEPNGEKTKATPLTNNTVVYKWQQNKFLFHFGREQNFYTVVPCSLITFCQRGLHSIQWRAKPQLWPQKQDAL